MPVHKVILRAAAPCSASTSTILSTSVGVTVSAVAFGASITSRRTFSTIDYSSNSRNMLSTRQHSSNLCLSRSRQSPTTSPLSSRTREKKKEQSINQVRSLSTITSTRHCHSPTSRHPHNHNNHTTHPALTSSFSTTRSKETLHPTQFTHSAPAPISIDAFHKLSDTYIDTLLELLEAQLAEQRDDVDVEYSSGVLKLVVPPHGTYVINKQPPNRQIWLSSPVSGPKRYDWVVVGGEGPGVGIEGDAGKGDWVYLRDGSNLTGLLKEELGLDTGDLEGLY